MLKPAESTGVSPEKEVRKTRASPFNKKSSSVLGRESKVDSSTSDDAEEVFEMALPKGRPQRVTLKQTTYVVSDSESEKSNDSDFDEDDD
ncbi:hypothetical protein NL676_022491 [Syzygium grande]|nr:hypothetical protein NL676_022491 [Syzygium grande]